MYDFSAVDIDKLGGMKKNGFMAIPYSSFFLPLFLFSLFPLSLPVFDIAYERFCTSSPLIRADRQIDIMDIYFIHM
jgi:hypothetical protein